LLLMRGPAAIAVTRHLAGWGFVAAAAVILAARAFDPLAVDVREGRVDAVEGAVGKRRRQLTARLTFTRPAGTSCPRRASRRTGFRS